ncbi:MAG: amidohydrolase, partial [Oribacterium sp.]|nr:amidohydrolase [Oribacterium sp.]
MTEVKQQIIDFIENNKKIFTDLSDRIWENPELSLKEFKSAAIYEQVLEENGFKVEKNFDDIETAFTGTFGSGRPVIGILGEYDALS